MIQYDELPEVSLSHPGCIHVELPNKASIKVEHEQKDKMMIEMNTIIENFLKPLKFKYNIFFIKENLIYLLAQVCKVVTYFKSIKRTGQRRELTI